MTPERWRRIDELFDAALRLDPAEREGWLRLACGGDDGLRAEVLRLLLHDDRADRERFLPLPGGSGPTPDGTRTWPPQAGGGHAPGAGSGEGHGLHPDERGGGFTPIAAIHPGSAAGSMAGRQVGEWPRLIGLVCLSLGLALLMLSWKYLVASDPDPTQAVPYAILIVASCGVGALALGRIPLSPARCRTLELGMIGMIAAVFAVSQYQAMLDFARRGDPLRAQFVMNHRVLIAAVLILCCGLYASADWRRTGLVVGLVAVLPFGTLVALYERHPGPMAWLGEQGSRGRTSPLVLVGFDAMLLLILAAGAASGAHLIARLRREVREARRVGQYRLRRRLGVGGMGEVYLAEHQFLKRPCALKLIRPGVESGAKALARFEREVRLTASLSHPNTVEIYDYGRTEDGVYYYVMEYLPGMNLSELVERFGPLPPGRAVYLLRQICLALREAHGVGLVHRDIKPSNIIVSRRGGADDVAKLLDFGLVRPSPSDGDAQLSDEGRILGTPLYMSPEQATGHRELDARSDLYSLGAVAYFLLTGRPPFDEGGTIGVLVALARDPAAPPSRIRDGIPGDLDRIVLGCLAKDPADRFPDAESLEAALGQCPCAGQWGAAQAARWWRESGHRWEPDPAEDETRALDPSPLGRRPLAGSAG